MRITVEADLQGLSKVYDDLTLQKTDLEIQIEELNKDLALLKKEHQEVRNMQGWYRTRQLQSYK